LNEQNQWVRLKNGGLTSARRASPYIILSMNDVSGYLHTFYKKTAFFKIMFPQNRAIFIFKIAA
jgi:hypothetical protein